MPVGRTSGRGPSPCSAATAATRGPAGRPAATWSQDGGTDPVARRRTRDLRQPPAAVRPGRGRRRRPLPRAPRPLDRPRVLRRVAAPVPAAGLRCPVYAPPGLRRRSYFADDPAGLGWRRDRPCGVVRRRRPRLPASRPPTTGRPPWRCASTPAGSGPTPTSGSAAPTPPTPGPDWSVAELGSGIGTVLCEATYTTGPRGRSPPPERAPGRAPWRRRPGWAGSSLTHRWPTVSAGVLAAEAEEAFGRPVHQAATGRVFEW